MKIADRGGHNKQATGTCGYVDEVDEDRKINAASIKYQRLAGNIVIDVTPGRCDTNTDLAHGVNAANAANVGLFASHHLNSTPGGYGVEVYYHPNSATGRIYAERVAASIAKLGFHNRGAKANGNFFELRNTKMPAIIIENFFADSSGDVALYRKVGADAIGKAIAEGIVGHAISSTTSTPSTAYNIGTVNVDCVNVRQLPSTNSALVGSMTKGETVEIERKSGDWYSTYYGNHGGYIYGKYLNVPERIVPKPNPKPVPSPVIKKIWKTVTASVLNVRNGQGANFTEIGELKKGAKVRIDKDFGNGWTSIYFGNHGGFVSSQYLK